MADCEKGSVDSVYAPLPVYGRMIMYDGLKLQGPYTQPGLMQTEIDDDFTDVKAVFAAGASMEDGVSGKKPIDTSFENTRVTTAQSGGDIHDIKRHRYPHREY